MGLTNNGDSYSSDHGRRVREMFAKISPRYDLLNHLLSANIDKRWRRIVSRKLEPLVPKGGHILDVACGTGDLSIQLFESLRASEVRVTGVDFCRPMLKIAAGKSPRIPFIEGDALQLPFASAVFDAVTIAFGLRNLASVERGLEELRRVLRPGGCISVLEFSTPVAPGFRKLFGIYFARVLPRMGGLLSGSREAYEYLPNSVGRFANQQQLAAMMRAAGFVEVSFENLTGGVAALHCGQRPP
jgi:demethylmenaquinone methyltransferase/2-methoxy-6-polyprenyl-1,4-benzoquinol methylase